MVPTDKGTLIYPGNQGGTNWLQPVVQSSHGSVLRADLGELLKRLFQATRGLRRRPPVRRRDPTIVRSAGNRTATNDYHTEEEGYGAIRAIDPKTGERKWEYKMTDLTDAGILTTASDLLFSGGREGDFSRWTRAPARRSGKSRSEERSRQDRSRMRLAAGSMSRLPPATPCSRSRCRSDDRGTQRFHGKSLGMPMKKVRSANSHSPSTLRKRLMYRAQTARTTPSGGVSSIAATVPQECGSLNTTRVEVWGLIAI